jgi:hypothetical protein
VVRCLQDHNITFEKALGVSSGAHGALAILGGANTDLGLRQCYDLQRELRCATLHHFFDTYCAYVAEFSMVVRTARRLDVHAFECLSVVL